jgi:aspartyl-tRNA(Asn)/glutamyl-tRNA(Gln) amidotransferase subunit B
LPKEAEKVRQGNQKVVMRLVGEVMKMSKGAADAKRAKDMFFELLK